MNDQRVPPAGDGDPIQQAQDAFVAELGAVLDTEAGLSRVLTAAGEEHPDDRADRLRGRMSAARRRMQAATDLPDSVVLSAGRNLAHASDHLRYAGTAYRRGQKTEYEAQLRMASAHVEAAEGKITDAAA